jgi:hypothetical protein
MKQIIARLRNLPLGLALLAFVACNLVSGTFVVTVMYEDIDLATGDDFYYQAVDVTTEEDWEDHKDDIKDIDNIGFELWMDNNSGQAITSHIYVAPFSSTLNATSTKAQVMADGIKVFSLPLPNQQDIFIGYAESFDYVSNIQQFRDLAESGQFKFFAFSDNSPIDFAIDSAKVIVTVSAGK